MRKRKEVLAIVYQLTLEYLHNGIDDYETIIRAVSESLSEELHVKQVIADSTARKAVDKIWADVTAEAESNAEEARDFCKSYNEAYAGEY